MGDLNRLWLPTIDEAAAWEATPNAGAERFTGRTVELLQTWMKQVRETAVGLGCNLNEVSYG
ncbi:MAG: hypothetical protein NZT92_00015 [Abditibacteriales bacterium]|nr:hypothetical protein [Abditibacteriales bacterium]MDW8364894.1 hypothetical protein [Abditibacteriales bacterium]